MRGWHLPDEDAFAWCIRKSAEAYNAEAQQQIELLTMDNERLRSCCEELDLSCRALEEGLRMLIEAVKNHHLGLWKDYEMHHAAEELSRWLEEREKE